MLYGQYYAFLRFNSVLIQTILFYENNIETKNTFVYVPLTILKEKIHCDLKKLKEDKVLCCKTCVK